MLVCGNLQIGDIMKIDIMPIRAYLKRKLQHIAKVYKLFVLLICYILFSNFMFYNGDYVLSSFEIEAVSIIENQDKKHSALLPTDEQIKQSFIETLTYIPVEPDEIDKEINAWSKGESYNRNKLTVEEGVARELSEMSSYFTTIESHIPNLTDKEIDTLRINSTIAVNSFYRLTDILSNEHTQFLYYLQQTLDGHHKIRRKAIDEKNSRNP
jgi:hypothetical protein